MLTIQNDFLIVSINPKGAELDSIYHKQHKLEYLWSGDPAFWAKKSPILFPIVGTLKNNTYYYEERSYELSRHGFAREREFAIEQQSGDSISLALGSDDATIKIYPFAFQLIITYTLEQNFLSVSYKVKNEDKKTMFFSIGGHPAFKVPLEKSARYEDYYLEFDSVENAGRWPISADGLIESASTPILENSNKLLLTKELFRDDAVVFKYLNSHRISLKADTTTHGLNFDYSGFPYLGIWAAKNADFVCIEPWCGIADSVDSNQQLLEKEGIQKLQVGQAFERTWKVELY